MGYPRTMGAGLAGSTTKIYGNANVNQIQYGNKLQGLPPVTGRRDPYRIYKTKAGGNAPGRFRVFCVNQLGGIGMANKNSQFAPNADGLGWCPNRKNSRERDIGINKADRGNDAIRFQSRADEKAEFEILTHEKGFRNLLIDKIVYFFLMEGQVTQPVGTETELLRKSPDSKAWNWTTERLNQSFDIMFAAQPLIDLVSLQDPTLAAVLERNLHLLKRQKWMWGELVDHKPGGPALQDLASLKPFSPKFEAFLRAYFDPLSDLQLQKLADILYSSSTLENAIIGAVSKFPAAEHKREILEADFSILLEFAIKYDIVINMDRILADLGSLGVTEQAIQIVENAYTRIKQEYASIDDVIDNTLDLYYTHDVDPSVVCPVDDLATLCGEAFYLVGGGKDKKHPWLTRFTLVFDKQTIDNGFSDYNPIQGGSQTDYCSVCKASSAACQTDQCKASTQIMGANYQTVGKSGGTPIPGLTGCIGAGFTNPGSPEKKMGYIKKFLDPKSKETQLSMWFSGTDMNTKESGICRCGNTVDTGTCSYQVIKRVSIKAALEPHSFGKPTSQPPAKTSDPNYRKAWSDQDTYSGYFFNDKGEHSTTPPQSGSDTKYDWCQNIYTDLMADIAESFANAEKGNLPSEDYVIEKF